MQRDSILHEARRLFDLGFGVHWLKKGLDGKKPVSANWANGTRQTFKELEATYQKGYGLGVRLGKASTLRDGTKLVQIDLDIKSSEREHHDEALAALKRVLPKLSDEPFAPTVVTGYGRRILVRVAGKVSSKKLARSKNQVSVYSPSTPINQVQLNAVKNGQLTKKQLEDGYRLKAAWEIELMGDGKQAVLPPSIHPDTGTPYTWSFDPESVEDIPLLEDVLDGIEVEKREKIALRDFKPSDVDYMTDVRFSADILTLLDGENSENRSDEIFVVAMLMLRAGFDDNEILTVLTDRETHLGECGYDHTHSDDRARAAYWVLNDTLLKAKEAVDPATPFKDLPLPPETEKDAEKIKATNWRRLLKRGKPPKGAKKGVKGPLKDLAENVHTILSHAVPKGLLRYDEVQRRIVYGDVKWDVEAYPAWGHIAPGKFFEDLDASRLLVWFGRQFDLEFKDRSLFNGLLNAASDNAFNAAKDMLSALPPWDGHQRLNTWLSEHFCASGDAEYLAQVLRKWLVASVSRVLKPGTKFDWMPIFEGPQGIGKSSFGSILFGKEFFLDQMPPNFNDKDASDILRGKVCVEFSELAGLSKSELSNVKGYLTRTEDTFRPAYGKFVITSPRTVVFYGTTNDKRYLRDETGNRRFCPVQVGQLDFKALVRDREQMLAEALHIAREGLEGTLELEGAAKEAAELVRAEKMVKTLTDIFEDLVRDWVSRFEDDTNHSIALYDLFAPAGPLGGRGFKIDARHTYHAALALERVGFQKHHTEKGNKWVLLAPHGFEAV